MATTVAAGFAELLKRLDLTATQNLTATTHINNIVSFFKANFVISGNGAFYTGSFRRGTMVRWTRDVDIMGRRILFASVRDDCAYSDEADCKTTGDIGPYHTLYVMNADGSQQTRLSDVFAQIADWSPDGRYVVFGGEAGLGIMRSDGSDVTTLPTGVSSSGFPDWTA